MTYYTVIDTAKTSEKIRELRKKNGYTTTSLAKEMGISHTLVSKWENKQVPTVEHILHLARIFKVPINEFLIYQIIKENR